MSASIENPGSRRSEAPPLFQIAQCDSTLTTDDLNSGLFFRVVAQFISLAIIPAGAGIAASLQSSAAELALASVQQQQQQLVHETRADLDRTGDKQAALCRPSSARQLHLAIDLPGDIDERQRALKDTGDRPHTRVEGAEPFLPMDAITHAFEFKPAASKTRSRLRRDAPRPVRVATAEGSITDRGKSRMSAWTTRGEPQDDVSELASLTQPTGRPLTGGVDELSHVSENLFGVLQPRQTLAATTRLPPDVNTTNTLPHSSVLPPDASGPTADLDSNHVMLVPQVPLFPVVPSAVATASVPLQPRDEEEEEEEDTGWLDPGPLHQRPDFRGLQQGVPRLQPLLPSQNPPVMLDVVAAMGIPTILPRSQQHQYERAIAVLRARESRAAKLAAEAAENASMDPSVSGVLMFAHTLHSLFGGASAATEAPVVPSSAVGHARRGSADGGIAAAEATSPAAGPTCKSSTDEFLSVVPAPTFHDFGGPAEQALHARERAARYRAAVGSLLAEREAQRRVALDEITRRRDEALATGRLVALRVAALRAAELQSVAQWRLEQRTAANEAAHLYNARHQLDVARARDLAYASSPVALARRAAAQASSGSEDTSTQAVPRRRAAPKQYAGRHEHVPVLSARGYSPLQLEDEDRTVLPATAAHADGEDHRQMHADESEAPTLGSMQASATAAGGGARAVRIRRVSVSKSAVKPTAASGPIRGRGDSPEEPESSKQAQVGAQVALSDSRSLQRLDAKSSTTSIANNTFRSISGINALLVAAEADVTAKRGATDESQPGGFASEFSPAFIASQQGSSSRPPFRPPAVAPGIPDFLRSRVSASPTVPPFEKDSACQRRANGRGFVTGLSGKNAVFMFGHQLW